MSESYLGSYAPILLHLILAAAISGAIILLSWLVGQRKPNPNKMGTYECGILPTGDAREPVNVKFYLVAMLFILFDVEAVFLFPWSFTAPLGWYGFVEMFLYIVVLFAGGYPEERRFDWSRS
jgi:NADH-quinone oxidoreductase subunit A